MFVLTWTIQLQAKSIFCFRSPPPWSRIPAAKGVKKNNSNPNFSQERNEFLCKEQTRLTETT